MDLLLSLLCGSIGGLAYGGLSSLPRATQILNAALGLFGGWASWKVLDHFSIGVAHVPALGGALDAMALAIQIGATGAAGALVVTGVSNIRRMIKR